MALILRPAIPLLFLEYSNGITKLWQNDPAVKCLIPGYAREATYIDYPAAMVYRLCDFGNQELYHSSMAFDGLNKVELVDGTREILGYNCKKATTVINSNRIDIW